MAKRSASDALALIAPPPPPSAVSEDVVEVVDDLARILALPKRPPLDCNRDPVTKRYHPRAQALIEIMTGRLSRGPRVSCACRERVVRMESDRSLVIRRVMPEGEPEEDLIRTTVALFVADNQTCAAEVEAAHAVSKLWPGQEVTLPAADGGIGHPCIRELNPVQAWTLWEAPKVGGILGFLGVGSGKSAVGLLAPLLFKDCNLAVILAEPSQKQHYVSQYKRVREHFRVTSIVIDDVTGFTVPGTPPLHFVPYSKLSQQASTDLLERLNPDLIIDDEAHRVAGISARERRQTRYITHKIHEREQAKLQGKNVRKRAVRLLSWSGTLESKGVKDTQRLSTFSLGRGSPLPIDPVEAENWSAVMDPSRQPDRTSSTAHKLLRAFGSEVQMFGGDEVTVSINTGPEDSIRRGFRQRRLETLGVISTTASSVDASIYLTERDAPPVPEAVMQALRMIREGTRPDGDPIAEKSRQIMYAKQCLSGFYSVWVFSKSDPDELIQWWFDCRRAYFKELRAKLLLAEVHMDSENLCMHAAERYYRGRDDQGNPLPNAEATCITCDGAGTQECSDCGGDGGRTQDYDDPCETCSGKGVVTCPACEGKSTGLYRGKLPTWASVCWPAWRDIKDRVKHDERIRWIGQETPTSPAILDKNGHIVGEYLARDAAEWATKNKGVVWCISRAMGEKLSALTGLPYHAGGVGGEERLRAERGDRSVICSIKAYGSGFDGLQTKFHQQLWVEMPSSNLVIEQLLGRLHRQGQRHDEVFTEAYGHGREIRDSLRKVLMQAEFNLSMTGNAQKILLADKTGFGL